MKNQTKVSISSFLNFFLISFFLTLVISSLLGKRSLDEGNFQLESTTTATTTTTTSNNDTDKPLFYDVEDFNLIKKRLNEVDQKRELVIKKSRDIQKLSKQAIFSLHGKRFQEAKAKLQNGKEIAEEIKNIILDVLFLFLSIILIVLLTFFSPTSSFSSSSSCYLNL